MNEPLIHSARIALNNARELSLAATRIKDFRLLPHTLGQLQGQLLMAQECLGVVRLQMQELHAEMQAVNQEMQTLKDSLS